MSRTLFIYVFRDLLRIFLLAVGVLSLIMTFGGLLRPLYEFGLNIGQVGQVLSWSTPAMWAYSLPIAALFATTIVYGRLGADNEITACRAAGISHLSLTLPAFLLGLFTAAVSLILLCLIVPACTLRVEQIIYSNIAELIVGQIQRQHQIRFGHDDQPITVFAQDAYAVPAPDLKTHPTDQAVQLIGPVIVKYLSQDRSKPMLPEEFFMAQSCVAVIRQNPEQDSMAMTVFCNDGAKYPRSYTLGNKRSMQLSVQTTSFGPSEIPSPVKENTKFMDVFHLWAMLDKPEQSNRIRTLLAHFIDRDQSNVYLGGLLKDLNGPAASTVIDTGSEKYRLTRGSAVAAIQGEYLELGGEDLGGTASKLEQIKSDGSGLSVSADEIRVKPYPDVASKKIDLDIDMLQCTVHVNGVDAPHADFTRSITVPMSDSIAELTQRSARSFFTTSLSKDDQNRLQRELYRLNNSVISELWARVSFAVSGLVLVMVGCALGMIFRSGNFLNAFAVSVVPALLSIALIVTGQHTAENVPYQLPLHWTNTLRLGVTLIVSGNACVCVIGIILLARLQRQ